MTVTHTSLFAYRGVKTNIGAKQKIILNAIKAIQPCSDVQIAEYLAYEINRVTPRRGELAAMGKIVEAGKVKNKYNRPVNTWKVKE